MKPEKLKVERKKFVDDGLWILEGKIPVTSTGKKWDNWFHHCSDERRVALHHLDNGITISTAYIGCGSPLFQTIVFKDISEEIFEETSATWAEAEGLCCNSW